MDAFVRLIVMFGISASNIREFLLEDVIQCIEILHLVLLLESEFSFQAVVEILFKVVECWRLFFYIAKP